MRAQIDEAIRMVREQRPGALEHALALLQDTVLGYSLKICGRREDAEDNTQEVLVKTSRFIQDFDSPVALSVWLYKVAKNQCLMKRRRNKNEQKLQPFDEDMPNFYPEPNARSHTPEALLLRLEQAEFLLEQIRALPKPYREVVTLHDLEELDTRDIAHELNTSEGSVRVRLHRARKLLRDRVRFAVDSVSVQPQ